MKKLFGIILFNFIVIVAAFSQQRDERNIGAFERIKVGQGIEVELIKGTDEKAEVIARGIDIDRVVTEVRMGTLRIYLDGHQFRNVDVQVEVTFTELEGIIVSSAGDVYSRDKIISDKFDIEVSSAGGVDLNIDVQSLEINSSSSSSVELSGKAINAEFDVSSAGSIRAYDLEVQDAYIRASSAGSVKVTVTKKIDARASSAGSIRYKGNPAKEYTSSSSGGSVRKSY